MALTPWIESVLSRDAILRSPLLCGCIKNGNELSLDDIWQLPTFGALDISRDELRRAIWNHKTSPKISIRDVNYLMVVLDFIVDPTTLVIRTPLDKPQQQQLKRTLAHVCNESGKMANTKGEISIKFHDPAECFAFWRALPYIPISGLLLEAHMSVIPQPEKKDKKKSSKKKPAKKSNAAKVPEVHLKPSDFPPLSSLG